MCIVYDKYLITNPCEAWALSVFVHDSKILSHTRIILQEYSEILSTEPK